MCRAERPDAIPVSLCAMSVGEFAGLLAAFALVVLVGALSYPLVKLGKVFDETRKMVRDTAGGTGTLLEEVTTTVRTTNGELEKVDAITEHVRQLSANVAGLSSLFAATLGRPLVKIAAFSYGIRKAILDRRDQDVERRIRDEIRAEKRARRSGRQHDDAQRADTGVNR